MKKTSFTLIKLMPIIIFVSIFVGRPLHNWLLHGVGVSGFISTLEFSWAINSLILVLSYLLVRKAKVDASKQTLVICLIASFALLFAGTFLFRWISSTMESPALGYLFQFVFQMAVGIFMVMIGLWLIALPREGVDFKNPSEP